ncbi:hypothetical protein M513_13314 [Trichuris suis]|uniref:Uncharacterized protein n=1 Tax=Trichuris suis TaxID=68888 RepID=A0A085LLG6_9BILA|nr:hypothetical protein M513_13314 [Trichuris suis]
MEQPGLDEAKGQADIDINAWSCCMMLGKLMDVKGLVRNYLRWQYAVAVSRQATMRATECIVDEVDEKEKIFRHYIPLRNMHRQCHLCAFNNKVVISVHAEVMLAFRIKNQHHGGLRFSFTESCEFAVAASKQAMMIVTEFIVAEVDGKQNFSSLYAAVQYAQLGTVSLLQLMLQVLMRRIAFPGILHKD